MSTESRLPPGMSEAPQPSPDKEVAEFDWDKLLEINLSSLQEWTHGQLQELFNTFVQVTRMKSMNGVNSESAPFAGFISTPNVFVPPG